MTTPNKGLIFKKPVSGWPKKDENLAVETRQIDLNAPPAGGIIVKNHYISFDPYQRGRMREATIASYSMGFPVGKPIDNRGIATVVSAGEGAPWKKGDVLIIDGTGTEEYTTLSAEFLKTRSNIKLENPHNVDPKAFIGALGMPGLTAYSSLYEIGKPKKGDVIFISSAAGAVGALVGQLAKHEGLKVVGSVGDDEKLKYIKEELGFDDGFNYKTESVWDALKRMVPEGIDIYYENVGGEQLDGAINYMKQHGRIIACGMISQYNTPPEEQYGVKSMVQVVGKRLTIQGFIVTDPNMGPKYFKEHRDNVSKWIADGSFKAKSSVTVGIDNAFEAFVGMLQGKNFGKAVLEISPLES